MSGKRNIDWPPTVKLWEESPELRGKQFVYFTNDHTGRRRFKVKRASYGKNKVSKLFTITMCRKFNRSLGKKILDNPNVEYYEH